MIRRRPALLVFTAMLLLGAATAPGVPPSDDARFYVPAAASYGRWIERALSLETEAWSRGAIDAAFSVNHEHPPVGKYVMALGWLTLHHRTGWLGELEACRAGVMLLWAMLGALLFSALRPLTSTASALFAAAALASLPRLLYHGHAETLDMPVAALVFAAMLAIWRAFEAPSLRRGAVAILLFALALGTKLNAPFALAATFLYALLLSPPRLLEGRVKLPALPHVLTGALLVSPLLAWALWPWLWFDTAARLAAYVRFHAGHYGILFYYGGRLYAEEPAPWHAPWVMLALTTPLSLLGLAAAGALRPLWTALANLPGVARPDLVPWQDLRERPALRLGLFALLQALAQLAALSLPGVPLYGGEKLFLPALPFVVLLAGLAFFAIERQVRARLARPTPAVAATALLLLLPSLLGAFVYRRAPLSYYGELAGGLLGAVERGYERQYYDLGYPELAAALGELLPEGGRFAVLPNPKEYAPHLARWRQEGRVPAGLELTSPERADILVLTHERRWPEYADLVDRYRRRPLLYEHAVAGVRLFSVYDLRR